MSLRIITIAIFLKLASSAIGVFAQNLSYDPNGFLINGSYKILRGGSLQWFRIPESEWEDRVEKFKAAGFNTIDMYVPWNLIEPEEGRFNFSKPSILRFLDLAKAYKLYVYFRPGPYITNEMDGGGFPAWLFAKTTKKNIARDGKVNLRTSDPDYLDYVRKYFAKLNSVIRPYLLTNGGPIILYAIENEFDWFENFFQGSKLFRYQGAWERPFNQETGVTEYFTALRDMLHEQNIDIPITSCPGNAKVAGMGNVAGIIPMPNIYNPPDAIVNSIGDYKGPLMPEKIAYDIVASMHDPLQFEGIYTQMPSASTETFRNASTMKRMLTGGLKGFFAFNIVGFYTPGYHNSITLSNRKGDHIKFDREHLSSLFLKPSIGYFHNVIDFYGAIGPSGMPREKFYEFRKANLFYDSYESVIGKLPLPSKVHAFEASPVMVANQELGAKELENDQRFTYWNQLGEDQYLVSLVNETEHDIVLPPYSLKIGELDLPRYSHMSLPLAKYPGPENRAFKEKEHTHLMLTNIKIAEYLKLAYTTSEILSQNLVPSEKIIIVYGKEGTEGEISLKKSPEWKLDYLEPSIKIELQTAEELVITYRHLSSQFISLRHENGQTAYIMICDDYIAPRTWSLYDTNPKTLLIAGPDLVQTDKQNKQNKFIKLSPRSLERNPLTLLAKESIHLAGYKQLSQTKVSKLVKIMLQPNFSSQNQSAPTSIEFRDAHTWPKPLTELSDKLDQQWQGAPLPFEKLGVYKGGGIYSAEFVIEDLNKFIQEQPALHIQHASDIIGIYLNGNYLGTLSTLGSHIKSHTLDTESLADFTQYLKEGSNEFLFKVEIWGHGSFMWPRGRLSLTKLSIPSLGFDAFKGIWGSASIGSIPLTNWKLFRGPHPLSKIETIANSASRHVNPNIPLELDHGKSIWWTSKITRDMLPNLSLFDAPYVLEIKGKNCKASIFLDGQVLGRWISDEAWLQKGTWVKPIRNPWVDLSPDHFPLPLSSLLANKSSIELGIFIEDTSSLGYEKGQIESIKLVLNKEEKGIGPQGNEILVSSFYHKHALVLKSKLDKVLNLIESIFF